MQWFWRSWFLICLVVLLPSGMIAGWHATEEVRQETFGRIDPGAVTIAILFLMSFSLDSSRLRDSFRSPGPVVWGTIVNIGLMPLLAWPFSQYFAQPDLAVGIVIAAVVPCTLATASVSTRQARGNDAVSLLITLLTNLISVVLTPWWLKWLVSIEADIDPWPIIANLAMNVLLPTLAGQLARYVPQLGRLAMVYRVQISIAAQSLVLLIVTKAAFEAGGRLRASEEMLSMIDLIVLTLACTTLHLGAMGIADAGGRWLRIARVDRIATLFAGSQKTLPIGLLLAAMPAITGKTSMPFVTFPLLLFHAIQLMVDSAIADRIARHDEAQKTNNPAR